MLTKLNDNPDSTKTFAITTEWTYAELELIVNLICSYCATPGISRFVYSDTANDRPLKKRGTADTDEIVKKILCAMSQIHPLKF